MGTQFNTRIRTRRDTEANWAANDPVLLNGELIITDTDDGTKLKVGDGASTYSMLDYLTSGGSDVGVEVTIEETICENIELNDTTSEWAFDTEITLDSDALYYLGYEVYDSSGNYDELNSFHGFSKVNDSVVRWLSASTSNSVYMNSSNIVDTWRASGYTALLTIYKISINKTDPLLVAATNYEGHSDYASGNLAHAEGYSTKATGQYSHAEGYSTQATGSASHAEGFSSSATVDYSHAEGFSSRASATYAHAEGYLATASGVSSHAEGYGTKASGAHGHAEGAYTTASSANQHVEGKYNVDDAASMYAHIVGNGVSGSLSNAHTLDWNGNAWFAGDVYTGGTEQSKGEQLATQTYVDEAETDADTYADAAVSTHNTDTTAHSDIRDAIPTNVSELTNDSGYLTSTVSVADGGTGRSTLTSGYFLQGNGTSAVSLVSSPLAVSYGGTGKSTLTSGSFLVGNGTSAVSLVSSPLSVSYGGTGLSTLTSGYFLRGTGTSAVTLTSADDVADLLGVQNYVCGYYTGDAATTDDTYQSVVLGFCPSFVIIFSDSNNSVPWFAYGDYDDVDGTSQVSRQYAAIFAAGIPALWYNDSTTNVAWTYSSGFRVRNCRESDSNSSGTLYWDDRAYLNRTGYEYDYIAFE